MQSSITGGGVPTKYNWDHSTEHWLDTSIVRQIGLILEGLSLGR